MLQPGMLPIANILTDGLMPAAQLLLIALAPLIFFTWVIHVLERLMQQRLARRFGWNAVMITGWLGTPIHELSHALMCAVFQHDIVDMKLFEPDRKNGRLGYVTHTYQKGNWYQEIGSFFIGVAPLLGGTAVLLVLLMIFFPETGRSALFSATTEQPLWPQVGESLKNLAFGLFQGTHLISIRLWLFLYLVVCVGSHMAPSWSDYEGGTKGGLMLLVLLLVSSLVVALLGPDTGTLAVIVKPAVVPIITVMIAVIALCSIATLIVYLVTEVIERIWH